MGEFILHHSESGPQPLVSVLVTSFNQEKYLVECLDSVKSLTYWRLELIVSDDCSKDGTFALAEQWVQKNAARFERTLVVRQPKNLGIVGNFQFLFSNARGDYLAYIACDDVFLETAIESRLKILRENRGIDAVFGNAQLISSSGSIIQEEFISKLHARMLTSGILLVSNLLLDWKVPGPAMMLRREATLENGSLGFLPADLKAEDRYIYVRLAARGKLRFVNEVVAKYRLVPGSGSRSLTSSDDHSRIMQADMMNRHLISGFNRIVLEVRLARNALEVERGSALFYRIRVFLLRCVNALMRAVVAVCVFIPKGWHQSDAGISN